LSSRLPSSENVRAAPLDALLRPRSIAILGASARPSLGRSLLVSLETLGFDGAVYPVNPKYSEVLGRPSYPSLSDVPQAPDVVAFCVGYTRVMENLKTAAEIGARGAVIYDGGFAERGEEGLRLQSDITAMCRSASIALCGPNCMGIINPHDRSSIWIQELRTAEGFAGSVGLVTQSGSIGIGMIADIRRFGFSHVISSGNEALVPMADYIDALTDDPETRVIALFIESVREPERFVAALDRAAAAGKPVVVLKVGRTERTQRAITSHTGGLAGSSKVFSEVLRAHRAIEVSDMDEFTEVVAACQADHWPTGRRIAVITASGGQAELILDVATQARIELPPLPESRKPELEQVIGPITGDGNPLDAWGNGDYVTNLTQALKSLDASDHCDNIVLCADNCDGQPMGREERALEYLGLVAEAAKISRKPHFAMGMRPGVMMRSQVNFLRGHGLAMLGGARQGLGALDRLARWNAPLPPSRISQPVDGGRMNAVLAADPGRKTINEFDAKTMLGAVGLPVTREAMADSLEAARAAAAAIGYPVVLKAVSDDIPHKSDHGLVVVDLANEAELAAGWNRLAERIAQARAHGAIAGVMVQEMVVGGLEVFAGVSRDADFGLVLAFGIGGVAIEVTQDAVFRMLPLRAGDAMEMVGEIRMAEMLRGVRGAPPLDVPALIACLEAFAEFAWAERDAIAEIDLNPIKLLPAGQGCRIVDALIVPHR
jgi:acetate---CoA ligase (ADP-forming)